MNGDELQRAMEERRENCKLIARRLRKLGYQVDWNHVNRHFTTYERWVRGFISTGYLQRITGIKRQKKCT